MLLYRAPVDWRLNGVKPQPFISLYSFARLMTPLIRRLLFVPFQHWNRVCSLAGTLTTTLVRRMSSEFATSAAVVALSRITSVQSPKSWNQSAATCRPPQTNMLSGAVDSRCIPSLGSEPGTQQTIKCRAVILTLFLLFLSYCKIRCSTISGTLYFYASARPYAFGLCVCLCVSASVIGRLCRRTVGLS